MPKFKMNETIIITVKDVGAGKEKRLILQKTQWQNILDFFDIAVEFLDPDEFRESKIKEAGDE